LAPRNNGFELLAGHLRRSASDALNALTTACSTNFARNHR
jgi:hypothetical protein